MKLAWMAHESMAISVSLKSQLIQCILRWAQKKHHLSFWPYILFSCLVKKN